MVLTYLSVIFLSSLSNAIIRKVPVDNNIYKYIEKLVEHSKDLHEASYKRENQEITKLLTELIKQSQKTQDIIVNDNVGAQHMLELLKAVSANCEKARGLKNQEQRDVLRSVFEKLTRITQRYYVGNYRTFYCQKTKDLWIQRSWIGKNPINPKSRCGVLAN